MMKHEYTTKETAAILGVSDGAIKLYGNKGFIQRSAVKGSGRHGIRYLYTAEAIQACADRIGIKPNWEASGRVYIGKSAHIPMPEPAEELTVLHEWVVIRLGEMFLTDNMALTDSMDKAKRWGTEARDSIRQHSQRTGGKPMLVQTIVKEMKIDEDN